MAALTIICNLILLTFGSFMSAVITYFLYWCIGSPNEHEVSEGRIFSFYGLWLFKKYTAQEEKNQGKGLNKYKAMGMCIYCFGTYISLLTLILGFVTGIFHLSGHLAVLEIVFIMIFYPS